MIRDFVWRDAGRTVVLRHDGVAQAPSLLAEHGFPRFELLSTQRALAGAPGLAAAATAVHEIGPGPVPDLAAPLLGRIGSENLVALGGGRPIDVAKAVASVSGARVAAIPTTMSGAEMTGIHRLPSGVEAPAHGLVRPRLVIADPAAMSGQPERQLRFSSINALAHGADSLYTPFANPFSEIAALGGADLIAGALDCDRDERDNASLALGSLFCGYAIDSALFGLHHVICQTLVRVCGTPHGETNAAILPRSAALLAERAPYLLGAFADAISTDLDGLEPRLLELGGDPPGLAAAGADPASRGAAIAATLERRELAFVPGSSLTREELGELIDRAW